MINAFSDFFEKYGALSGEAKIAVESISTHVSLTGNEIILTAGSTMRSIYLVLNGSARLYYYHEGKEITNQFFFEREVIADMESIYSKKRSNYYIQLLENCRLIEIKYQELEKLYRQHHDLEHVGRMIAIACYLEENERNRSYQMLTAKERYLKLLETHPGAVNRVNLGHISSYIGITQVQLSRIRSELASF